jgi:antitoxin PrlF
MPRKAMLAMKHSGHVLLKVRENLRWREVMSKGNVVSFTDRKAEIQAGIEFLDLLDRDIKENPEGIQPIPRGLLQRIQAIRNQADDNRRRELQEG